MKITTTAFFTNSFVAQAAVAQGWVKIHALRSPTTKVPSTMEWFFPTVAETSPLPRDVPSAIYAEFREAEACASAGAWRAASAMIRSALEKLLKANGYKKGSLEEKIAAAAEDHVINHSRAQRAQADVRVLGNNVLHDEWREVDPEEYERAHHYAQRIAEDFYDDRATVEQMLKELKRLPVPDAKKEQPQS